MMTVAQVSEHLTVSQETVLSWIGKGELVAADVSRSRGKKPRWRIADADLEAFLARRRNQAPTQPTRRTRTVGDVIQFFK